MSQAARRQRWWRACLSLTLTAALLAGGHEAAGAHGKDLDIKVAPLTPDPEQPLVRLYVALVRYAGDGEPLDDATVIMRASRQEGDETNEGISFSRVQTTPGLYAAEVHYRHFGTFDIALRVDVPLGQGEGEVNFVDHVRPVAVSDARQAALELEAQRVLDLQTQLGFGWWPDVANIAVRALHSLAGALYFALTGPASLAAWGVIANPTRGWLRAARRRYTPLMWISLALLLAAGLYSAWFNAPVRPPGLFNPRAVASLPYGASYLAVFMAKPVIFAVLVLAAMGIRRNLDSWSAALEAKQVTRAQLSVRRLRLWTLVSGALGGALVVDVAALVYLHYLSHLGVFVQG